MKQQSKNKSNKQQRVISITRGINKKEYQFTRKLMLREAVYDWASPENFSKSFQLSDLNNYTEFTALFDQYKIDRIDLTFHFSQNVASVPIPAANIACLPIMYHVVDFNDATALSIPEQYMQYQNCIVANCDKFPAVTFKPLCAQALYNGTFSGYGSTSCWVDTDSPSVQWYGSKFCIDPLNTNSGSNILGYLSITITYHITCRMVK